MPAIFASIGKKIISHYTSAVTGRGGGGGDGLGPELVINGDFASSVGWTLTQATISGGLLTLNGASIEAPSAVRTAAEAITAGTYRYSFILVSLTTGAGCRVTVGGTLAAINLEGGPAVYTGDIISVASTQTVMLSSIDDGFLGEFDDFSVKRVL